MHQRRCPPRAPCPQVFRTYNASITLDRLLHDMEQASRAVTVDEKKAEYDRANKEVRAGARERGGACHALADTLALHKRGASGGRQAHVAPSL